MILDKIKRFMPYIITVAVVVTLLVIQFTIISPKTFKWDEFAATAGINAAIIVIIAATWQSAGKDKALNEEESPYRANLKEYAKKIDEVNAGKLAELSEFCRAKSKELKEGKRNAYLTRHCVDNDKFRSDYITMSGKQLKAVGLNWRQRRAVRWAKLRPFFTRHINPVELMTDSRARNEYDVHYNEALDRGIRLSLKIMRSLATGAAVAMLGIDLGKNIRDLTAWAMFGLMIIAVVTSAWSGYRDGYNSISETKKHVLKKRVMFLNLFLEWYHRQHPPAEAQTPKE